MAALPLALAGCLDLFGEPSRDEVAWAKSPDGQTHAILIETNGGATTSFGYNVQLHPADHNGQKPVNAGHLYGATRSGCAYGVNMRWTDADTLALEYLEADQVDVPSSVSVGGRTIKLVAKAGVDDEGALCGGMLASLKGS